MTTLNYFKRIFTPLLFLLLPFAIAAQETEYLFTAPAASNSIEKLTSAACDSNGKVYLADESGGKVLIFDDQGKEIGSLKTFSTSSGNVTLEAPRCVFVNAEDNLYIFDEALSKIIVQKSSGENITFGEKGGSNGQINNVRDMVVDSEGYIYLLNQSRKQIDVFQPNGEYLTFIHGGIDPLKDPTSLGINSNNEVYVLDAQQNSVIMFDVGGNQVNMHRNFTNWEDVSLTNIVSMAACDNGDFFVLGGKTGNVVQISRAGKVLGNYGGKGESTPGSFNSPSEIFLTRGKNPKLLVLDESSQNIQVFSTTSPSRPLIKGAKRIKVKPISSDRKAMSGLAVSNSGVHFVIPKDNNSIVVAYDGSTSREVFSINNEFKNLTDLCTDGQGNLYVADAGGKEVFLFDSAGVLVRGFGSDIPQKLKKPISVVVQSNGNVVVADASTGHMHMWNGEGIYQKIITSTDNSSLSSFKKLQVDSKDQIYIWDEKENKILRTGSNGWPVSSNAVEARPSKYGGDPGKISGFFVDPLDKVYVFNSTNHQIEVYSWEVEPKIEFSVGYSGDGPNGFGDVDNIVFDPSNYLVHFSNKSGDAQKTVQLRVKPPSPEATVSYRQEEGELQLVFSPLNNRVITGYGAMTKDIDGNDSLAFKTESSKLTLNESHRKDVGLTSYGFVSLSNSDYSDPAVEFENHLGHANRLLADHQYDQALNAFQKSIQDFGVHGGIGKYLSNKLSEVSRILVDNAETGKALNYVTTAYPLASDDAHIRKQTKKVMVAYFGEMANRGDLADIISDARRITSNPVFQSVVTDAIDSLGYKLGKIQNERSIDHALTLGLTIHEWNPANPHYATTLARNYFNLYNLRLQKGGTSLELQAHINNAEKFASHAIDILKRAKEDYYNEEILHFEILNQRGDFKEVETAAVDGLTNHFQNLSKTQKRDYRLALARSYSGQSKDDLAVDEYNRIISNLDKSPSVKDKLGKAMIANKQYDRARDIYRDLLANDADNAAFTAQIGIIELLSGNFSEASFQLEKAIASDPAEKSYYGPLAMAYEGAGNNKFALNNYPVAIQYQKNVLKHTERSIGSKAVVSKEKQALLDYQFSLAQVCDRMGDHNRAMEAYRDVLDTDPSNGEAFYGLGIAARNAGLIYDAIAAFKRASDIDPDNEIYRKEHAAAEKQMTGLIANKTPLSIENLKILDVYPSLYRNYADRSILPIGRLIVANNTDLPITPSAIRVFCSAVMEEPTFVQPTVLAAYTNSEVDLSAILSEKILEITSDQRLQIEVTIEYSQKGKTKFVKSAGSFLVHGRNAITWSDKRRLAAFASPSDETLIEVVRQSDQLFKEAPSFKLNGSILQAIQLYTLIHTGGYVYSPDPVQSFALASTNTTSLDYLQYPAETIKRKSGDCDDLVTLMAALLENSGVSAAYIDIPGHVMMAFDAQIDPSQLMESGLLPEEAIEYQERIWIPVETTVVGKHGFMSAWKKGAERYYRELNNNKFPEIVPLSEARRVYRPSSFIPKDFDSKVSAPDDLIKAYDAQVSELLAKVNRTVISNLESRYQTEPDNLYVKNQLAALLAQIGQEERAESILLDALELSPENPVIINNLGNINLLLEDGESAVKYYSLAAELDADDGEIQINLCKAYLMLGDKKKAESSYEKAVKLDPELGYLYDELKTRIK